MVPIAGVSEYSQGRRSNMSTQEERLTLAEYWMEKADESLRAARVLLDAGITGASMSRL